jgi:hypothetical protein
MKKLTLSITVLFLSLYLSAQYKKASFFGKEGRTYEIGTQMYSLGDGKGSPIGFKLGFGSDQDGKQYFYWWDVQYIPSYNYSFATTDVFDDKVTVSGKTKGTFIYALHYSLYLLKNDKEDRKVKPYFTGGLNLVLAHGIKTINMDPESASSPRKLPADEAFNFGLGAGLGFVVNFTQKLGLKLEGGYNYQVPIGGDEDADEVYHIFNSHVYASAGLRLRIAKD